MSAGVFDYRLFQGGIGASNPGATTYDLPAVMNALVDALSEFGITHIGILVTAGWDQGREEFQRRCIEENWSKAELELEIKTRLGPRRQGGRRRPQAG